MTRKEYEAKLAAYAANLAKQDSKGSTGSFGKLADELYRRALLEKGINADCKVGCRKWDADDALTKRFGRVEIKTGCGAVAYGEGFTTNDLTADNVVSNADTIVWIPFPKVVTASTMWEMAWIFTREQFIATLEHIGRNGLRSSLKVSKGGAQLNIQTISPKMESKLWEMLESLPTVADLIAPSKLLILQLIASFTIGWD